MSAPTITDFLLARIAEDEATAQSLMRDLDGELKEDYDGATDERGPFTIQRLLSAKMWAQYDGQSKRRSFARGQQIATLADPARALAECKAKRAIIELHDYEWMGPDDAAGQGCAHDYEDWPCPTIRHLAAVYADDADYQEDWTA